MCFQCFANGCRIAFLNHSGKDQEGPRTKAKEPNFVVLALEVEMTYEVHGQAAAEWEPFPERIAVYWETTNLQVWNAREGTAEQQELVYEVSWIKELGMWRRFLTSRRKVDSGREELPC
jgi:hypothetical protein